ncbi:endo-alpha-N-acetylgalactosaminidase family protein [Paenibacillus psychroresistens]|nr:endo-alpha-N-acetylgalactosaminidase family protein [Paenibacillus psychroresistens]
MTIDLNSNRGNSVYRKEPQLPILLQSNALQVSYDSQDGLPYQYLMKANNNSFWGEPYGAPMEVTICQLDPRKFLTTAISVSKFEKNENIIDFHFETFFEAAIAVSFVIRYTLEAAALIVTLEEVLEHAGYELIEVSMPGLVSVREDEDGAWLAHGNEGGSLVTLKEAEIGALPEDPYFGKVLAALPVVMAGNKNGACALEVQSFLDGTLLQVDAQNDQRIALLGTVKTYRVNGSQSYNLNDGNQRNSGNDRTPNLLAEQKSICRLDFIGDHDGNGKVDWLDAAKLVQERMPRIPTDYYNDKLLYLIGCDNPMFEKPRTTFAQCEELISGISMLTDNAPQIAYLAGFQYEGHDTGYPAVDKVNARLGGYSGYLQLKLNAKAHNCVVSLDDNYDDAYMTSPQWDETIIARRPDGEIWKSRVWSKDVSYIIGLSKYMKAAAPQRVRFTKDYYQLEETTLIDVLSWFAIKHDWDPEHPASGVKNFFEGRVKLFDEFAQYGINVVSEQLRYPWVGKMSLSVDGVHGGKCPFGGQPIPLLPLIYKHSVIYGGEPGPAPKDPGSILFYNSRPGPWFGADSEYEDITDFYYLNLVPWMKLHALDIETFERIGELASIGLSGGGLIKVNEFQKTHEAILDGVTILKDSSLTCALDDKRIVFYSTEERELEYPLPSHSTIIETQALFSDRSETYPYRLEHKKIRIKVPARRPIMIYLG